MAHKLSFWKSTEANFMQNLRNDKPMRCEKICHGVVVTYEHLTGEISPKPMKATYFAYKIGHAKRGFLEITRLKEFEI